MSEKDYTEITESCEEQLATLKKKEDRFANLRLITLAVGLITGFVLYFCGMPAPGICVMVLGIAAFVAAVLKHTALKRDEEHLLLLQKLAGYGIARINRDFDKLPDGGNDFLTDDAPYAGDLDIFGNESLYKLISTAHTPEGRRLVAESLTKGERNTDKLLKLQEAVRELTPQTTLRLEVEAAAAETAQLKEGLLADWAEQPIEAFAALNVLSYIIPSLTVLLFVLGSVTEALPLWLCLIPFITGAILVFRNSSAAEKAAGELENRAAAIRCYSSILGILSKHSFKAEWLTENLTIPLGRDAAESFTQLAGVLNTVARRRGQLYIIPNLLFMWDIHCINAVSRWKAVYGKNLRENLNAIGKAELVISLAGFAHDNPTYTYPTIINERRISARSIAHPLLKHPVANDAEITPDMPIMLVTGSNMSGKSTFLRTIGVNLVLAVSGAPVCAGSLTCGCYAVYASMRISDDVVHRISSFYAEILKLRRIMDALKEGVPEGCCGTLVLLDEVFRGTNSRDRFEGACLLLEKLAGAPVTALISTHDLELADYTQEHDLHAVNMHFEESFRDGGLDFDYKLRPGVSVTRNALFLMKMAGIE